MHSTTQWVPYKGLLELARRKLAVTIKETNASRKVQRQLECDVKARREALAGYEKDALNDIREDALDYVESKLFELIDKGHPSAIIFFLKCQGKHRGYVERQEVTGRDGAEVILPVLAPPRATSMEEWLEQNRLEQNDAAKRLPEASG